MFCSHQITNFLAVGEPAVPMVMKSRLGPLGKLILQSYSLEIQTLCYLIPYNLTFHLNWQGWILFSTRMLTDISPLTEENPGAQTCSHTQQEGKATFFKSNPRGNKTEARGWERVSTPLPCQPRLFSGHVCKFLLHNILLIHVTSGRTQIWFALRVSAYTPPKVYNADFWPYTL